MRSKRLSQNRLNFVSMWITDIEPPKLSTCPGTVYAYCGRNSLKSYVVWKEPSAKDNHDGVISVTKEGSVSPGDRLSAGTYTVTYKAKDLAGNKADPCKMKVVVKGNLMGSWKRLLLRLAHCINVTFTLFYYPLLAAVVKYSFPSKLVFWKENINPISP